MKLKTFEHEGKTYAFVDDKGLPVYTHSDGRDIGFDAVSTTSRVAALNREAQTHRESYEQAQERLKAFEGIEDAEAARNALNTVKNLKAGDLKTAEQVAEIQRAAQQAAEQQVAQTAQQSAQKIKALEEERNKFMNDLYQEKVGGSFARSKFIGEKAAVPADMMQAMFGKHFKVEDGGIVPYDSNGNKIFSRVQAGKVADFEEGLEFLVESYPYKDQIYKGTGHSGTGAQGNNGGGGGTQGGKPTMSRQAFEALPPAEKGAAVKTHTLVDG